MTEQTLPANGPHGVGGGSSISPARLILYVLGALWSVELLDRILPMDLESFGLQPRSVSGLIGILTMPFLHGDMSHLVANTASMIVLGTLVAFRGPRVFARVTVHVMLVAGPAMWLVARSANHIGASVLIFGYLGFLLSIGVFERQVRSIVLSVLVGLLYGGMIWGVLPGQPGISWEGHLFGCLGGVHAARFLSRRADWRRP